ncbi:MAG TPA: hypothetical protein VN838_19115, partial [Bradyrhizobium sp.]|nr:hypothetical protein [Bradyrhizobium sp.]
VFVDALQNFWIQISNSQALASSRRRASWAFSLSPLLRETERRKTRLGSTKSAFRTLRRGDFFDPGTDASGTGASKLAIQAGFPALHPSRPATEGSAS